MSWAYTLPPSEGEMACTIINLASLTWDEEINGWGPAEKDQSNGEKGANNGGMLRIGSTSYNTGLGVHATSRITYSLNGNYNRFTSDLGIDEEVGNNGSVVFEIYLDGSLAFASPILRGTDQPLNVQLNVSGVNEMVLVVSDAGDGSEFDHADWGGAKLESDCNTESCIPPAIPTIQSLSNTQAGLTWRYPTSGNFRLRYRVAGSSSDYTVVTGILNTETIVTNLSPGTSYEWQVVTNCASSFSSWVSGDNFTTKGGGLSCGQISSLTLVSIESYRATLSWSGATSGTFRYREEGEGTWNLLPFTGTNITVYGLDPQKRYFWQVQENCGGILSNWVPGPAFTTPISPACDLPAIWTTNNIGDIDIPGSVCVNGDDWTIQGAGSDIFETSDDFYFINLPLVGDGEMIARVRGIELTNGWAKAGLMVRRNLDPNARYAMVGMTPSNGALYQFRNSSGASTNTSTNSSVTPPRWLRITRVGNIVTGYISFNGTTWNRIGSEVSLGTAEMRIGFAVSSHDAGELATSIFSDVSVQTSTISYPGFTINPDTLEVSHEEETNVVDITSPSTWEASSNNFFVTIDPSSGSGNGSLTINSAANLNVFQRTGRVTVTSEGESKLIVVRQAANPNPCTRASNLVVTYVGKNVARLNWDTEAGLNYQVQYRELTANNWTSLNDIPSSSVPYLLTGLDPSKEYRWRVRTICDLSLARFTNGPNFTTLSESVCELPDAWQAMDLGSVGISGEVCEDNGTWTVLASGTDIWNNSDDFHFVYQQLTGNMELTARVTEVGNANPFAKAGVMIREKLTANSRNVGMFVTYSNGIQQQIRNTEGQNTNRVFQTQLTAPYWLRIRREAGVIQTFYSESGEEGSWIILGPARNLGTADMWIGLAHTSHNNSILNRAVFTGADLQAIPPSLTVSPDTIFLPAAAGDSSTTVTTSVSWTAAEEADWLVLENTSGTDSGPLGFTYQENTETTARTAIVTVQAEGASRTLTLIQVGRDEIPPLLSASPSTFTLGQEAVDTVAWVIANVNWTATPDADWISVVTESGNGNDSLYFSLTANGTGNTRNGTILLEDGEGTTASISISQVGISLPTDPVLTITQPEDSSEVSLPFSVYYELENGVIAPDSFYIQYTIDDSLSGTWNKADSITFLNLEEGFRKITLRLGLPGGQLINVADSVVVNVVFPPYLNVFPDTLRVGAEASTQPINIQANQPWTVSEDLSWVIPELISGNNATALDIIVTENPDTISRTGLIYIQSGIFEDTVVIIQDKLVPPTCVSPNRLELAFLTDTSAILSWNEVAAADYYVLRYQNENEGLWIEVDSVVGTSVNISSLLPETPYRVEIRSICAFDEDGWSESLRFVTYAANAPFCPSVLGLSDEVLSDSSVLLSWNSSPSFVDFTLRVRAIETESWDIIPSTFQDSSWILMGLDPKLSYEWQVKGICEEDSALWSASSSFTTGTLFPSCQAVTGIDIVNVTDSTALIRWNPIASSEGYLLSWQILSGSSISISDTLTDAEYLIEFLFPDTSYEFSIVNICSSGEEVSSDTIAFQTTSGGVIPTETVFTRFALKQNGPAVQIDWGVQEGLVGKSWFSVERSFEGQFFERIARVEVADFIEGDSTAYLFFDDRVPFDEWIYYRVRLIFNSGQYSITQTRRVMVEKPDIEAWIYPNPTRNSTQLSVLSPGEVTLTISLYSHLGNEIFKRDLPVGAGWVKKEIDLTGLRPGMYYLTVYDPNPNPYIRQSKSMILMIH